MSALLAAMDEVTRLHPWKLVVINVYSHRHYEKKLKPTFDHEWKEVDKPAKACLAAVNSFICDSWNSETPEFWKALEKKVKDNHMANLEEYTKGSAWQPWTAKEYYEALSDTSMVVAPFADAFSQCMGLHVCIMLAGPMNDGKISSRRYVLYGYSIWNSAYHVLTVFIQQLRVEKHQSSGHSMMPLPSRQQKPHWKHILKSYTVSFIFER